MSEAHFRIASGVKSGDATTQPHVAHNTIAFAARKAEMLFQCCLDTTDQDAQKLVDLQLSRYRLWTSNIGVFATRHASLDYRLRTAAEAASAVLGNIEILCEQLLFGEFNHRVFSLLTIC
jgi:hypothetical protein